jgi:hypothetical protein
MGDLKANALMTIAAVLLTFSAAFVVREKFQAAVIVLMCFCMVTILLATFAVMPGTPLHVRRRKSSDLPMRPGFNLLFFGSFAGMDYAHFEAAMEEMMNDPSKTYEAMVREVYTLGVYLARKKYRYLRLAYIVFSTGLFAAGLTLLLTNVL